MINDPFTLLIHRLEPHILEHEHYTKHSTPPRNPYRVNSNHREDRVANRAVAQRKLVPRLGGDLVAAVTFER